MVRNMIYMDNAATTLIKPQSVFGSAADAMKKAANPGRSGHKPSAYAADKVYECREVIAQLFGMGDIPQNVVFTYNATHALNIAIKSVLHGGGHAVISSYEHNSVVRPIKKLESAGVTYKVAECPLFNRHAALQSFETCISEQPTDCVIVNHISNVFGYELPIYEIDKMCCRYNIPMIVDASQSAGAKNIDVKSLKSAAYICMPGHKSLYGLQGTGVLLCCKDKYLYSIIEGGTGSNSLYLNQPDFLPDIFESGTLNVPGIAALCEGVKFIRKIGISQVAAYHRDLTRRALEKLMAVRGIKVVTGPFHDHGVISFYSPDVGCEEIGEVLARNNICVRSGFHCAPLAHRAAGTEEHGTVRISFSLFSKPWELESLCKVLDRYLGKKTSVFY